MTDMSLIYDLMNKIHRRAYLGHSPAFYSARKMGCEVLYLIV